MAEKIQINLSKDQKKISDEQFLQAPRNWQKCSALVGTSFTEMFAVLLSFCQSAITATTPPGPSRSSSIIEFKTKNNKCRKSHQITDLLSLLSFIPD
jgi:hypothetical protein